MAKKMTKAQAKRALFAIQGKSARLFLHNMGLTSSDYIAMEKIINRAINRLK